MPTPTANAATDGRTRLLDAARAELAERGTAGLSLRSIARRADLSHAAPKYHFGDRAGLLTAVATTGYLELSAALDRAVAGTPPSVATLGRAYVEFGLRNLSLFDLMFRPSELHPDDPDLQAAQASSLSLLRQAVSGDDDASSDDVSLRTMASWTFAHGIVELLRNGALQAVSGADAETTRDRLVELFEQTIGVDGDGDGVERVAEDAAPPR